jgi:pyrroline-5-carboxylate reductase
MPKETKPILHFVGGGNMGSALIRGILAGKKADPHRIFLEEIDPQKRVEVLSRYKIRSAAEMPPEAPRIMFLCIKPQQFEAWARGGGAAPRRTTVIVSIMAGVTRKRIAALLPGSGSIVRGMPNLPGLMGAGITALCGPAKAIARIAGFFSALGETVVVPREPLLDAVTAVSGSGPAYVFALGEYMVEAAVRGGLERGIAEKLVRQTLRGSAALLQASPHSARELRRQVTSPGGTTEAAFRVLDQKGWGGILRLAIAEAKKRAGELAGPGRH